MNSVNDKSKLIKTLIGIVLLFFVFYIIKHDLFPKKTATLPPPPVIIQKPILLKLSEYVTQTGNTVAYNSVDLVARIEGYLNTVNFVDGSFVKKDQLLFVIEPQPYKDKLVEAKASVAAQKASYTYAKVEHARQEVMYKQNATSLNNVQKWQAKRDEAQANVEGAIANADFAGINYSYTHVLAPFDGRIGRHLVDPGNLVGNGKATDLATIEQINPIYVYFNLNELDLIKIRAAFSKKGFHYSDLNKIPVYVAMQNEVGFPHAGKLDFVNTGLNSSTGTIEFRAILENEDYALLPGLFVQVRIPISGPTPQLTVPDTAIQYDQIGPYLLAIGLKNHVVLKRVELGVVEQGKRAIVKGIDAQTNVIIDGLQNAALGLVVSPSPANENKL